MTHICSVLVTKKIFLKRAFFKILTRACLNYSDLYSVTSKSDYEFILSNYNFEESKLVLRPNWVLVGDSNTDIYNKKDNLILSVGRLEKQKNYHFLINVLKNKNLELTIVGDGSEKENLLNSAKANQVKLNIENNLNYHELLDLFRNYKYFILPSIYGRQSKSITRSYVPRVGCLCF